MHGADSDQIQTYLLYSAEYSHFKELALAALTKLEAEKRKSLEQVNSKGFRLNQVTIA